MFACTQAAVQFATDCHTITHHQTGLTKSHDGLAGLVPQHKYYGGKPTMDILGAEWMSFHAACKEECNSEEDNPKPRNARQYTIQQSMP